MITVWKKASVIEKQQHVLCYLKNFVLWFFRACGLLAVVFVIRKAPGYGKVDIRQDGGWMEKKLKRLNDEKSRKKKEKKEKDDKKWVGV